MFVGPKVSEPKVDHAVGNLEHILQKMNQKASFFFFFNLLLDILDMVEAVTKT